MKIDYISDVHIDFFLKEINPEVPKFEKVVKDFVFDLLPDKIGDVLIVPGDISHYLTQTEYFLKYLKDIYSNVLFTHGNHDLYLISDNQRKKYDYNSFKRLDELKEIASRTGTIYLDGDIVTINGVTFGGLCGWYNLPEFKDKELWKNGMNDSNYITEGSPYVLAYGTQKNIIDTNKYYREQTALLDNIKCDVLFTHISQIQPPKKILNPKYEDSEYNIFYYVNNFDKVQKTGCKHYIYGHTHDVQEYEAGDIHVHCNPLGYPSESMGKRIKSFEISGY
jgi:DNA repair exonuclease SbcCD nuclease subunit